MSGNNLSWEDKIRLSIITQFYPPDYAATGQLIEELAIQLSRLGMKVDIFTGQPGYAFQKKSAPARENREKIQIRRSRTARMWHQRIRGKTIGGVLFCLRCALHLIKRSRRVDILLVTTAPPFLPILCYFVDLFFGLSYVCLLYDIYPDVAVELKVVKPNSWIVKIWNLLNILSWQRAKKIIVLSSSMAEKISQKCPKIADKIVPIHNWADPNLISPLPKEKNWFAQKYNLVNKFTVLYSGNLGRCHDLETILEAAQILQHEPVEFVFVGDGAKSSSCQQKVQQWGLKNCQFLPYQEKQNLPYSLTAGDLSLVSVSKGMEGLVAPSKFYGALASGLAIAVICESHSYLRELVSDAKCGKSFNNEDSQGLADFIRYLATNPEVAKRMGNSGRQYLEKHLTPEIIAQQYSEVLYEAVGKLETGEDLSVATKPVILTTK
ncbi:glycosyltransferase family 4 protein [Merismopedia glauca]|uniref:Glycosyltransferase WbuB n=1 Tax=Merismopedia glauca CCAP 1448/3 TaxID=1296344 RepID=A0A2T1C0I2_9CYAN|nr:glycosyltransferase family 4 protein [Merismopedia glauca]PSB01776.1 glycosyltransferase WbuB [Merismopedia glauca CCAP 1448/3]